MIRSPRRSPLFPSTRLSRSASDNDRVADNLAASKRPRLARYEVETIGNGSSFVPDLCHDRGVVEPLARHCRPANHQDRKSTRLNSSHANISYAVFCLKKKKR